MPERHFSEKEVYDFFERAQEEFEERGELAIPDNGIREEDEEAADKRLKEDQRIKEKQRSFI